mmetsp:Transcript_79993/g.239646  ORF Transcript_79993/g.239646 Transcript_79993/m.239646 type:complete len:207 (+) Transcript_79993:278-898(+)
MKGAALYAECCCWRSTPRANSAVAYSELPQRDELQDDRAEDEHGWVAPVIRDGMREDLLQLRQLRLCGTPHLKNLAGDGATEIAEPATAEAERREHRRRRLPDFRTEDAFRDDFRIGLAERRGHPEQRVPRAPRRDERLGGELAAVWVLVWICQREGGSCARSPTTRLVGVALTTLMRDAEKGRFDALRVKCVRRIEAKYVEGRRL